MPKNSVNCPSAMTEHGINLLMTRLDRTSKNWKWLPLEACQSSLTWPGLKHDNTCLAVVTKFFISRQEKRDYPSELFQAVQLLMVPWSVGTLYKMAVIQYFILASPPKIKAVIFPLYLIWNNCFISYPIFWSAEPKQLGHNPITYGPYCIFIDQYISSQHSNRVAECVCMIACIHALCPVFPGMTPDQW